MSPILRLNGVITSNTSSLAGMLVDFWLGGNCANRILCSLEKDTQRRASPWRMLEHPWIMEMKNKKVNMANFLSQVWDWK